MATKKPTRAAVLTVGEDPQHPAGVFNPRPLGPKPRDPPEPVWAGAPRFIAKKFPSNADVVRGSPLRATDVEIYPYITRKKTQAS